QTVFEHHEAGSVATGSRKALDIAGTDRIGNDHEYDRHGTGRLEERSRGRASTSEDDVGRKRDQFRHVSTYLGGIARGPADVNVQVAVLYPAPLLQPLKECRVACLGRRIVVGRDHADVPQALALLRARRERPCRRTAQCRKEAAAFHSITSSARASRDVGMSRPSALAVIRLMTKSNLVGCSTGMSSGLAPRKILSTNSAARRYRSGRFAPYDIRPPVLTNSRNANMVGNRAPSAKVLMRA